VQDAKPRNLKLPGRTNSPEKMPSQVKLFLFVKDHPLKKGETTIFFRYFQEFQENFKINSYIALFSKNRSLNRHFAIYKPYDAIHKRGYSE